jgi:hypothetical protein
VVGDVDGLNKRGAHLYLEGESDFMDSDDDDETSKYNTFVVTGIRNVGTRIVMEQPENGATRERRFGGIDWRECTRAVQV